MVPIYGLYIYIIFKFIYAYIVDTYLYLYINKYTVTKTTRKRTRLSHVCQRAIAIKAILWITILSVARVNANQSVAAGICRHFYFWNVEEKKNQI